MNKETKPPDIAIADRGMSNWRSVETALNYIGARAHRTDDIEEILAADGLVMPGVGAFPTGMRELRRRGLIEPINLFKELGKPILGICLGMQMFFESSSEQCDDGEFTEGLGWIEGEVNRLWPKQTDAPHIGWAPVNWLKGAWLGQGIANMRPPSFYHLHQHICQPRDGRVIAAFTQQAPAFVSAVQQDNLYGVQFHPEKSSTQGLQLLKNFVEVCSTDEARL